MVHPELLVLLVDLELMVLLVDLEPMVLLVDQVQLVLLVTLEQLVHQETAEQVVHLDLQIHYLVLLVLLDLFLELPQLVIWLLLKQEELQHIRQQQHLLT